MMPRSRTVSSPSSLNASAPSLMQPSMPTHFFPLGLISRIPAICSSRCTCCSVSFKCPLNASCSAGLFDPFAIFGIALVSCFSAEYKSFISSSSRSFNTSLSAILDSLLLNSFGAVQQHLHGAMNSLLFQKSVAQKSDDNHDRYRHTQKQKQN